ncbi:MAG TPA: hypothetical protein VGV67_04115, partial [Solirubrobacteraceae bacterium]|nr:hypothetical protein [Solirubrobacteraceae bacterium]
CCIDYPQWLPNGDRIVFGTSGGEFLNWLIDADGGPPEPFGLDLPDANDEMAWGLSFSPDGGDLALTADSETGKNSVYNSAIFVAAADGTHATQLTDPFDLSPGPGARFSPDGRYIAFDGHEGLYTIDLDGNAEPQQRHGPISDGTVDWSPDGGSISYGYNSTVWRMDPDGANKRALVTGFAIALQASYRQVDGLEPRTRIVGTTTSGSRATIAFAADEPATFACAVDGGTAAACTSPFTTPALPDGPHEVDVFATDGAGNVESSPASAEFTIGAATSSREDTAPPPAQIAPPVPAPVVGTPPPAPVVGASAVGRPADGTITFRPPGATAWLPLTATSNIPMGSLVDARRGRVRLTTATNCAGGTQTAEFWDGMFALSQPRACGSRPVLRLAGPMTAKPTQTKAKPKRAKATRKKAKPKRTKASRKKRKSRRKRRARRLWGQTEGGNFRTRGRDGATSVRGTKWLIEDRCDGTLVRVVEGVVEVEDFGLKQTTAVGAGEDYLAGAARPTC